MQFDRAGKLLQSWTEETFHVKSSHGLRVGPDGNIWCVDVDGHVVFKLSPEGPRPDGARQPADRAGQR